MSRSRVQSGSWPTVPWAHSFKLLISFTFSGPNVGRSDGVKLVAAAFGWMNFFCAIAIGVTVIYGAIEIAQRRTQSVSQHGGRIRGPGDDRYERPDVWPGSHLESRVGAAVLPVLQDYSCSSF